MNLVGNMLLYPGSAVTTRFIGLNSQYTPLDDARVRQALALGIDRERIAYGIEDFALAGAIPAAQPAPPAVFGHLDEASYEYDLDRARALLDEAGYPDGFEINLYCLESQIYLIIAEDIQDMLSDLYISTIITPVTANNFYSDLDSGNLSMFLFSHWVDFPDASAFDRLFNDDAAWFGEPYDDISALLDEAVQNPDPDARLEYYEAFNGAINEYVPLIPLVHTNTLYTAYRDDVGGAYASPWYQERFAEMRPGDRGEFVWLQDWTLRDDLNCALYAGADEKRLCAQVMETLVIYAPESRELLPWLADEWEVNEDATEWIFHLREGVSFHNGEAFTAEDVVASFSKEW
jgi:ABC-type transport system substrate-binding protein